MDSNTWIHTLRCLVSKASSFSFSASLFPSSVILCSYCTRNKPSQQIHHSHTSHLLGAEWLGHAWTELGLLRRRGHGLSGSLRPLLPKSGLTNGCWLELVSWHWSWLGEYRTVFLVSCWGVDDLGPTTLWFKWFTGCRPLS